MRNVSFYCHLRPATLDIDTARNEMI